MADSIYSENPSGYRSGRVRTAGAGSPFPAGVVQGPRTDSRHKGRRKSGPSHDAEGEAGNLSGQKTEPRLEQQKTSQHLLCARGR